MTMKSEAELTRETCGENVASPPAVWCDKRTKKRDKKPSDSFQWEIISSFSLHAEVFIQRLLLIEELCSYTST